MVFNEIIAHYERGHIVELNVQQIIFDAELIIFDLDGVSARLHVSNLSNNKELKNKFLIGKNKDQIFMLRGLIHPNSPINVNELEKLGINKILVTDDI